MPVNSITVGKESDCVIRSNSNNGSSSEGRKSLRPSAEALSDIQVAYDYFNVALFDGKLDDVFFVFTRKKNCLGHFAPDRLQRLDGRVVPELSLNPTYLALRDDRESLSTLAHEQAHVFRHYFGPLNRNGQRACNGYHDLAWVAVMERIGLIPSNTGLPGGKKTGYQMTHYIEDGGPFDVACKALLDSGFQISWADRIVRPNNGNDPSARGGEPTAAKPIKKDRIKFSCPSCNLNAWAKPKAKLACARHAPAQGRSSTTS